MNNEAAWEDFADLFCRDRPDYHPDDTPDYDACDPVVQIGNGTRHVARAMGPSDVVRRPVRAVVRRGDRRPVVDPDPVGAGRPDVVGRPDARGAEAVRMYTVYLSRRSAETVEVLARTVEDAALWARTVHPDAHTGIVDPNMLEAWADDPISTTQEDWDAWYAHNP